jgi:hypothetical protein
MLINIDFFVRKPEGRCHLETLDADERIILKLILGRWALDSSATR